MAERDFKKHIWRDDCAWTAAPNQWGNTDSPRAGWCPGAGVLPWVEDVSSALNGATSLKVKWSPQAYENTCRPMAPQCAGCTPGNTCAYNDGSHTSPSYAHSALLVVYK